MDAVKKPFYKKWWFWGLLIVLAVAGIGSQNENIELDSTDSVSGEWTCVNRGEKGSDYPDEMILYEDGTGVADSLDLSWEAQDDMIVFYIGNATLEYEYSLSDGKLYLDEIEYVRPGDETFTPLSSLTGTVLEPEFISWAWDVYEDNPTFTIVEIYDDGSYIKLEDQYGNVYEATQQFDNKENINHGEHLSYNFDDDIPFKDGFAIWGYNEMCEDDELHIVMSHNSLNHVDYYKK